MSSPPGIVPSAPLMRLPPERRCGATVRTAAMRSRIRVSSARSGLPCGCAGRRVRGPCARRTSFQSVVLARQGTTSSVRRQGRAGGIVVVSTRARCCELTARLRPPPLDGRRHRSTPTVTVGTRSPRPGPRTAQQVVVKASSSRARSASGLCSPGRARRTTDEVSDHPQTRRAPASISPLPWLVVLAGPVVVALALVLLRGDIRTSNVSLILVLVVVAAAVLGGRLTGVVAGTRRYGLVRLLLHPSVQLVHDQQPGRCRDRGLLLIVGLVVGELVVRTRRSERRAAESRAEVVHVRRLSELAAGGESRGSSDRDRAG